MQVELIYLKAAFNAATKAAKGKLEGTVWLPAPFDNVSVTVEDECNRIVTRRASETDPEDVEDVPTGITIAAFNFGESISRAAVWELADSLYFGHHAVEGNVLVIEANHLGKPYNWKPTPFVGSYDVFGDVGSMTTIYHVIVTPYASDSDRLRAIANVAALSSGDDATATRFIEKIATGSAREIVFDSETAYDSLEDAEVWYDGEPYEIKPMIFGEVVV